MRRRDFITMTTALGLSSLLPAWQVFAEQQRTLSVPPQLRPDARGNLELTLQTGQTELIAGKKTPTWGINGAFLGPTLCLERGEKVAITVHNQLSEPMALHWHGLEIPGTADGGPQATILPGKSWLAQFTVNQPAATCWMHPHTHHETGRQVAQGIAGLIVIEDEQSRQLPLPKSWGEDDFPVIFQDKRFTPEGVIDYQLDMMTAAVGWFGDMLFTTGSLSPMCSPRRGWVRLRMLNGCNARQLCIAASDSRPLYVIASDGGFLPKPVRLTQLSLLPGERFEVLVNTEDGKPFSLVTLPVRQMGMVLAPFDTPLSVLDIHPATTRTAAQLPDTLVPLPALPALAGLRERTLVLSMDATLDKEGMRELVQRYGEKALAGMDMSAHGAMGGHAASTSNVVPEGHGGHASQVAPTDHAAAGGHAASTSDVAPEGHGESAGMSKHDSNAPSAAAGGHDMPESHMAPGGHAGAPHERAEFSLEQANRINGKSFDMLKPAFTVQQGEYEKWIISGEGDMMSHPFHIHGTRFRILSENGLPPPEHRRGWKDIVHVENGRSEVLVFFAHLAPAERMYMAHCHLLEHEDTGMMLAFTVILPEHSRHE